LLDAGAEVFAERGYHAARVDDVVKAAATSHGTFYLYFSSKEDLFQALAVDAAEAMVALARTLPELSDDGDGDAALQEWLDRFVDLYTHFSAVIRTWTEAEIVDTEIGRIGGDLVAEFSRELARRLQTAAPDLDARLAAVALVAMIERSLYYLEARRLPVPRAELVATLATVTQSALFGARARTSTG
jgi:AcrR family transcriptional regulator